MLVSQQTLDATAEYHCMSVVRIIHILRHDQQLQSRRRESVLGVSGFGSSADERCAAKAIRTAERAAADATVGGELRCAGVAS